MLHRQGRSSKTLCRACHAVKASLEDPMDLDLRQVRSFAAVAEHLEPSLPTPRRDGRCACYHWA